jgi:hypothetical protein
VAAVGLTWAWAGAAGVCDATRNGNVIAKTAASIRVAGKILRTKDMGFMVLLLKVS